MHRDARASWQDGRGRRAARVTTAPPFWTAPQVAIARELLRRMGIPESAVTWLCAENDFDGNLLSFMEAQGADMSPNSLYRPADLQAYPNISFGPVIDQGAWQAIVLVSPPRGAAAASVAGWFAVEA